MEWNAIGVRAPALSSFQIITQSDPIAPDLLERIEIQPSKELFMFGSQGFWGFLEQRKFLCWS